VGTTGPAGPAATKDAAAEEPPPLDGELIGALKQALEDLFADQAVVTMRDVRLWLQSYTANVKARVAALQTDSTLSSLLLGGGSVVEIRYWSSPLFDRCVFEERYLGATLCIQPVLSGGCAAHS
jgi:hypothetical protein